MVCIHIYTVGILIMALKEWTSHGTGKGLSFSRAWVGRRKETVRLFEPSSSVVHSECPLPMYILSTSVEGKFCSKTCCWVIRRPSLGTLKARLVRARNSIKTDKSLLKQYLSQSRKRAYLHCSKNWQSSKRQRISYILDYRGKTSHRQQDCPRRSRSVVIELCTFGQMLPHEPVVWVMGTITI